MAEGSGKQHAAARTVAHWLRINRQLGDLAEFLLTNFGDARDIFIVGGALRDRFLTPPRPPKDIDVLLAGVSRERLQALKGAEVNFFGGVTLALRGLAADVWPLEDTYHIREFHLPKTIGGYLGGAPFNLDKIAYSLRSGDLYDRGCLTGVASRRIVYAPARPYLEEIQAMRCILLRRKTSFDLDDSAIELLSRVAERLRENSSAVPQMKRYLLHLKHVYDESTFDQLLEEIRLQPQELHA